MTSISNSRGTATLILGDAIVYLVSLVFTLAIRYGEIPSRSLIAIHLPAFSVLIVVFLIVNFSLGLYERQLSFVGTRMQVNLLKAQIANIIFGIVFFYLAPVAIAPKANLIIYFIISTGLLYLWRIVMYPVVSSARKQVAIIVGKGNDVEDLYLEINKGLQYGLFFKEKISPQGSVEDTVKAISESVKRTGASIIVADLHDPLIEAAMPFLYSLIFSGVQIIDGSKLYESIFGRIPLSMIRERWLVENSATALGNRRVYDGLKRVLDVAVSALGGIVSLIFYPFVFLAIKAEDRGPIFIVQNRIGKNGKPIRIYKFRSMSGNDEGKYGAEGSSRNVVTRVGMFLRTSRIDELPQLWNVLKGDLSLVGPRPELPGLAQIYEKEIPYYNTRHLVKPGLFGWAQIYHEQHPHHSVATEETRNKLSYDLYYIKNRSLGLDSKITLNTIRILVSFAGR